MTYIQKLKMPRIVISDTSTLILLDKIGELNLLQKVYGELVTTPEIAEEYGVTLPIWIKVQPVGDKKYKTFLETQVDSGEASAIALATEFEHAILILDDLKARKLAVKLKIQTTGTLGVINKAKQMSIIPEVKPLINKLLLTNFRISNHIIVELLKLNNE